MMNLLGRVSQLNPLLTTNLYIPFARYDPLAPHPGPPGSTNHVLGPCQPNGCLHLTQWLNGPLPVGLTPSLFLSDHLCVKPYNLKQVRREAKWQP